MRKKLPDREGLATALTELDGNMAAVARRFHVTRGAVWRQVNGDSVLRELTDELRENFKDEAESILHDLIRDKNPAAVIFYLKTQGRDRGYSERLELMPITDRDIEVELGEPTLNTSADQGESLNGHRAAVALLEQ